MAKRREQRVVLAELQAAAAADPTVIEGREPEELLIDALHDTNATLQALKAQLWELGTSTGAVNPGCWNSSATGLTALPVSARS